MFGWKLSGILNSWLLRYLVTVFKTIFTSIYTLLYIRIKLGYNFNIVLLKGVSHRQHLVVLFLLRSTTLVSCIKAHINWSPTYKLRKLISKHKLGADLGEKVPYTWKNSKFMTWGTFKNFISKWFCHNSEPNKHCVLNCHNWDSLDSVTAW